MTKDEIIKLAEQCGAYVGEGVSFHRHEFEAFAAALAQQPVGTVFMPVNCERGPCTVCGVPYAKHGSYPTCATHSYTTAALAQQTESAPEPTARFSCHLERDFGKAPCDRDCGKLRCMYPSEPQPVAEQEAPTDAMLNAGAMQIAMNEQRVMTAEGKARLVYLAMRRAA